MANLLVCFGFSWMVVAALIGLTVARRHEMTVVELENIAAKGSLAEYHRLNFDYKSKKLVHVHAFLFATVSTCVGLAMAHMNYSQWGISILGYALIVSTVVWTIGGARLNRPLMVIGDLTLLASLGAAAVGMARAL